VNFSYRNENLSLRKDNLKGEQTMIRDFTVVPIVEPSYDDQRIVYPTKHKLAIQARQSKKKQTENNRESYEAQTTKHQRRALRMGWSDDDIIMFIENKRKDGTFTDASGTKRVDDRPTMQDLWYHIEHDLVKAVMTRGVDRLFRHREMVEPAQFAELCRQHHCIIITDMHTYDFNKRYDDTGLFLKEAQAGADYIEKHIKMMLRYRREKALRGEWDGRQVPIGFILDDEKLWYLEYEPHSRVVRWVFKRFRQLSGNFADLWKEVYRLMETQGYLFPAFPTEKHTSTVAATSSEHGYIVTEAGLKTILVNPVYLGWWLVHETVDKGMPTQRKVLRAKLEDNHPVLVDENDFWYAYKRLVEDPKQRSRYSKVGTISVDALLEGILTSDPYPVYVNQHSQEPEAAVYVICDPNALPYHKIYGSIGVRELDTLFTTHLLSKLEAGKKLREEYSGELFPGVRMEDELDIMEAVMVVRLQKVIEQQTIATSGIDVNLADYKAEAASLERTLHFGAAKLDDTSIVKFSERLASLNATIGQMEYKKKRAAAAQADLAKFSTRLDDIPGAWNGNPPEEEGMTLEDKRRFINLVVERLILRKPHPNWLALEIQWLWDDAPSDICYIWQRQGNGKEWSDAENDLLRELYPSTDRATILEALPDRRWSAISNQAATLGLSRFFQWNNTIVPRWVSLEDANFMTEVGIPLDSKDRYWWTSVVQNGDSTSLVALSAQRKSHRSSQATGSTVHSASS
jgi:hypothetical protein